MAPVVLTAWAAWDRSGLRLDTFCRLVDDLEATGHCLRIGNQIAFPNIRSAQLLIGGRAPRPRPTQRKGRR